MSDERYYSIVSLLTLIASKVTDGITAFIFAACSVLFAGLYFANEYLEHREKKARR